MHNNTQTLTPTSSTYVPYYHRTRFLMEWKKCYTDVILVPLGLLICMAYHLFLWHKVRTQPLATTIGINSRGRRLWVSAMMEDTEKKNILAVQTLRNTIMGSTLMATTSILLCSGLAAVISSTYSIRKPLNDAVYGAQGEFMVALKYVTLLLIFLFSFVCHSSSIRLVNHVNFLINCPMSDKNSSPNSEDDDGISSFLNDDEYVSELLERSSVMNTVGNRLFYAALPMLLWIFGPVLVFLCEVALVLVMYNLDFVFGCVDKRMKKNNNNGIAIFNGVNHA